MVYEPKIIPEGINTSKEHPLREFAVLVFGIAVVIVIITSLLAVSTDYLIQYIPLKKEHEWFANEMSIENKLPQPEVDTSLRDEVEQQLQRLVEQLRQQDKPEFRFTVGLFDSDVPNAFVMPGGRIFITSGLLRSVASENGLAMVLAHEMGHQYHRHPLRSLGRGVVISLALMVVSGTENDALVESFVGNTAVLTSLGFNREQEHEADLLGIDLLIQRYGHASGSTEFFETMREQSRADSELPEFLSTHPGVDQRIDLLRERGRQSSGDKTPLPEVIAEYLESIENS
ncbi:MAG: M48 family metallopeptidase [Gammaproteobacteria bacterium]|nr:M48 family metallopeptidase [Gammaproteobacteria bacterium]